MAKELSFRPTGKRHDADIPYQDFDILLGDKKLNRYDFSLLQIGNVMLKFDMKDDGTFRIRLMGKGEFEIHPIEKGCPKPIVLEVKK